MTYSEALVRNLNTMYYNMVSLAFNILFISVYQHIYELCFHSIIGVTSGIITNVLNQVTDKFQYFLQLTNLLFQTPSSKTRNMIYGSRKI